MKMKTTLEFLDDVAAKHGGASDYRLAKILGVTKSAISGHRCGRSGMSDEIALKVAHELNVKPEYVLACVHRERAKAPELRAVWERMGARIAAAVVMGVGVGGMVAGMMPPDALPFVDVARGVCVLCKIGDAAQIIDLTPFYVGMVLVGFLLARRAR